MVQNKAAVFLLALVVGFVVALIAYRGLVGDQPRRSFATEFYTEDDTRIDTVERPLMLSEAETSRVDSTVVSVQAPRLHRELLAMREPSRGSVFSLAIRDAGFDCSDVTNSHSTTDEMWVWRVHCSGALIYWVAIDDYGYVSIEPVPYWDDGRSVIPYAEPIPMDERP